VGHGDEVFEGGLDGDAIALTLLSWKEGSERETLTELAKDGGKREKEGRTDRAEVHISISVNLKSEGVAGSSLWKGEARQFRQEVNGMYLAGVATTA
jgi:hypothetical protein